MSIALINRLGDWNPQLLRELKGRLKFRNVALAASLSLLGQLLLVMSFVRQLPVAPIVGKYIYSDYSRYCTGTPPQNYYPHDYLCLRDNFGNFAINWAHWWLDVFVWLSIAGMFALLVAGTYMVLADQDTEDRRGTLNFIRLSPRSAATILLGKLLGVPVLLYLAGMLAIPLHWGAGIAAQIPPILIASYYGVLLASGFCFYSAALLFGTVSSWLGGFQPWLGSGTLFFLLCLALKPIQENASDLLNLLSPSATLTSVIWAIGSQEFFRNPIDDFEKLRWFDLPAGQGVAGTVALSLLIYGFLTYWIWQALLRRFPNPGATPISKRQSYLLVAGAEILLLGFALKNPGEPAGFASLSLLNLLLFLGVTAALTPNRQALHDWARYRHANLPAPKGFWHNSLMRDLVWGEKSPALVAVGINLASATAVLLPWALRWKYAFPSIILGMNFILIYAALAQLMLFVKTQKPAVWAVGSVAAAALLPPILLGLLSATPEKYPAVWLFSAFPAFWSWEALNAAPAATVFAVFVAQWLVLLVLSVQLARKLRRAGESASKALLAGKQ
ncbi:ABC transporter permease [Kamptonema formosum]|uniref:ABC transporter permease n=1 Tax=Kamptonema formosum TaxID=331992 RepID=UPI00034CBC20|nr:ABC transporter permease [Oscillatoria sp. PCC 10802]